MERPIFESENDKTRSAAAIESLADNPEIQESAEFLLTAEHGGPRTAIAVLSQEPRLIDRILDKETRGKSQNTFLKRAALIGAFITSLSACGSPATNQEKTTKSSGPGISENVPRVKSFSERWAAFTEDLREEVQKINEQEKANEVILEQIEHIAGLKIKNGESPKEVENWKTQEKRRVVVDALRRDKEEIEQKLKAIFEGSTR